MQKPLTCLPTVVSSSTAALAVRSGPTVMPAGIATKVAWATHSDITRSLEFTNDTSAGPLPFSVSGTNDANMVCGPAAALPPVPELDPPEPPAPPPPDPTAPEPP